jgi:hypothetical protein
MVMIEYALRNAPESIPQSVRSRPNDEYRHIGQIELKEQRGLARQLGLFGTIMVVMGGIIGQGFSSTLIWSPTECIGSGRRRLQANLDKSDEL